MKDKKALNPEEQQLALIYEKYMPMEKNCIKLKKLSGQARLIADLANQKAVLSQTKTVELKEQLAHMKEVYKHSLFSEAEESISTKSTRSLPAVITEEPLEKPTTFFNNNNYPKIEAQLQEFLRIINDESAPNKSPDVIHKNLEPSETQNTGIDLLEQAVQTSNQAEQNHLFPSSYRILSTLSSQINSTSIHNLPSYYPNAQSISSKKANRLITNDDPYIYDIKLFSNVMETSSFMKKTIASILTFRLQDYEYYAKFQSLYTQLQRMQEQNTMFDAHITNLDTKRDELDSREKFITKSIKRLQKVETYLQDNRYCISTELYDLMYHKYLIIIDRLYKLLALVNTIQRKYISCFTDPFSIESYAQAITRFDVVKKKYDTALASVYDQKLLMEHTNELNFIRVAFLQKHIASRFTIRHQELVHDTVQAIYTDLDNSNVFLAVVSQVLHAYEQNFSIDYFHDITTEKLSLFYKILELKEIILFTSVNHVHTIKPDVFCLQSLMVIQEFLATKTPKRIEFGAISSLTHLLEPDENFINDRFRANYIDVRSQREKTDSTRLINNIYYQINTDKCIKFMKIKTNGDHESKRIVGIIDSIASKNDIVSITNITASADIHYHHGIVCGQLQNTNCYIILQHAEKK